MKKLIIGLVFLASVTTFASDRCTFTTTVEERGEVERAVFDGLKEKGYIESNEGALTITELYTYDHGGDGFNSSTIRMRIQDNSTGLENVYFGNSNMFVLDASRVKSARDLVKNIPTCK